ncbi:MAG: elongation factor 1-beta [Candidatus Freyarchaeota archaeon]|nr:elongation factor 1-beta [Candidatus Freyrarchaeum guaymaensis]
MAKVVVTVKVFPVSTDVPLDQLLEKIRASLPEGTELHSSEKVPIAFGLNALRVNILVPEEEGGASHVEKAISSVDDVSEIEVEMVRRI